MPLTLRCDGCLCDLPLTGAATRGRLAPLAYCPACAAVWDACEQAIDAARVAAIDTFGAARAALLATAREQLKAVPDE